MLKRRLAGNVLSEKEDLGLGSKLLRRKSSLVQHMGTGFIIVEI